MGMSLILLVGAALMFQTLASLLHTKPGFDSHNVLTFDVGLLRAPGYDTKAKAISFYDNFAAKLSALPGVQQVSYASTLPLNPNAPDTLLSVEGDAKFEGQTYDAGYRYVSPNYLHSFHIPLIRGRELSAADSSTSEPVVMINEAMEREIWAGSDPIGQHIWFGKPAGPGAMEVAPRRIVGIVGDVNEESLAQNAEPIMYIPYTQTKGTPDRATFIVRTSQDPHGLAPAVRNTVHNLDSDLPLGALKTLD